MLSHLWVGFLLDTRLKDLYIRVTLLASRKFFPFVCVLQPWVWLISALLTCCLRMIVGVRPSVLVTILFQLLVDWWLDACAVGFAWLIPFLQLDPLAVGWFRTCGCMQVLVWRSRFHTFLNVCRGTLCQTRGFLSQINTFFLGSRFDFLFERCLDFKKWRVVWFAFWTWKDTNIHFVSTRFVWIYLASRFYLYSCHGFNKVNWEELLHCSTCSLVLLSYPLVLLLSLWLKVFPLRQCFRLLWMSCRLWWFWQRLLSSQSCWLFCFW